MSKVSQLLLYAFCKTALQVLIHLCGFKCQRTIAREGDSTNTRKAIEIVLQNKLSIKTAAKEFGEKRTRLAYLLVKRIREDGIDKVALTSDFKKSAAFLAEMEHSLMECSSIFLRQTEAGLGALQFNPDSDSNSEGFKQKRRQTGGPGSFERGENVIQFPPLVIPFRSLGFFQSLDVDFMFSFASARETHPVASTSAAEFTYVGVVTVSTTDHSAQATRVGPQKGNFPVAETSTVAILAQFSMENTIKG
ncbi:hypothetical protein ILUMI_06091 [Ignelater luminosus]|uniref:HTH psq-type domain-containing protein n=1 Tax=Ignelater luminosus TaxID=2038154 RepID=A0A8K0DBD1_IGNLU|nr:hypothetical protein ILUMI_06091 [Ignelater luminosus]